MLLHLLDSSQQPLAIIYENDLAFLLATKIVQVPAESYTTHMKHTQAKSHGEK